MVFHGGRAANRASPSVNIYLNQESNADEHLHYQRDDDQAETVEERLVSAIVRVEEAQLVGVGRQQGDIHHACACKTIVI